MGPEPGRAAARCGRGHGLNRDRRVIDPPPDPSTSTSPRRRFDLVIFDCDGVLVDSERLSIGLDVELLEQLGWPLTEAEVIERFVGRTDAAMRAEVEEHVGRDISVEWAAFSGRYLELFAAELEPVAHVAEAMNPTVFMIPPEHAASRMGSRTWCRPSASIRRSDHPACSGPRRFCGQGDARGRRSVHGSAW